MWPPHAYCIYNAQHVELSTEPAPRVNELNILHVTPNTRDADRLPKNIRQKKVHIDMHTVLLVKNITFIPINVMFYPSLQPCIRKPILHLGHIFISFVINRRVRSPPSLLCSW